MRTGLKISIGLYAVALFIVAGFGVVYAARGSFMPYHAEALDVTWDQLSPRYQVLFLALLKIYGATMIALAIAGGAIVAFPLRNDERWAKITMPIVSLCYAIPSLLVTLYVHSETGASTPWPAAIVGIVLVAAAALLSFVGGGDQRPKIWPRL